jgi:hypothetical protein
MAAIDLRNATVRIKDGYVISPNFLVNNGGGYAMGATTMAIDGNTTQQLKKWDQFTVVGSSAVHTITNTPALPSVSITFTPGLTGAVLDNAIITVLPHELDVKIGEGNMTYSEKRNIEYVLDRGVLDTVKEGDDEPVEVKLDFTWEFLRASSGQIPTISDALKKRGEASHWVSSSDDLCEPYAVDIEIEYIPPCGGEQTETILLQDFRHEQLDHDLRQATVSVTGKCNVKEATVTRG